MRSVDGESLFYRRLQGVLIKNSKTSYRKVEEVDLVACVSWTKIPSQELDSCLCRTLWLSVCICVALYDYFHLTDFFSRWYIISESPRRILLNNKCKERKALFVTATELQKSCFAQICVTRVVMLWVLTQSLESLMRSSSCREDIFWWRIWSIKELDSFYLSSSLEIHVDQNSH